MLTVVCFKWYDPNGRWNKSFVYGVEHVLRLRAMVARHLKRPHRFICATDDREGLPSDIGYVPLNDRLHSARHRYAKLDIFRADAASIYGDRILALDLDAVITGPLDPLLEDAGDFKIWGDTARGTPYNSSMVYLDAGARPQVYDEFDPVSSPKKVKESGYIGTDQAWIGWVLGPHEKKWTASDGVLSYKRDCIRRNHGGLPDGARIVFFHGEVDPSLKSCQSKSPWIKRHWVKRQASCLILGGSGTLHSDVDRALALGEFDDVIAVNDAGAIWPGEIRAWVTLHPEKLEDWTRKRKRAGFPPALELWSNKTSTTRGRIGVTLDHVTEDWRGSSGLLAVKAALEMGYRKIVLCGIPMDDKSGHFFDQKPQPWKAAPLYRPAWQKRKGEIGSYVRSMSGWTKDLLGEPDTSWLMS